MTEHSHDLRLELPAEPVWLDADPVRLAQVIGNLLSNAARFTSDGGTILLTGVPDAAAGRIAISLCRNAARAN